MFKKLLSPENLLLLILASVQFVHIMDFMIMMPLGPQLMRIFDINPQQFGFLVSAYTISAGIFGFLGAFVVDKLDRKTSLFGAFLGFTLGTFACALAPNFTFLVSARILTGAFGGVLSAQVLAIVGDAFPIERRASAMGVVMAAFSVASVLGVPAGLYAANLYNWHAPFFILGAVSALVCLLIWYWVPSMRAHLVDTSTETQKRSPFAVLGNVLQDKNQLWALCFMMVLMLGQFTVVPYISTYMVANVGFSEHDLTYIYMVGGAFTIFSSPVVGRLSDKFGKLRLFTIFAVASLIPVVLYQIVLSHFRVKHTYTHE